MARGTGGAGATASAGQCFVTANTEQAEAEAELLQVKEEMPCSEEASDEEMGALELMEAEALKTLEEMDTLMEGQATDTQAITTPAVKPQTKKRSRTLPVTLPLPPQKRALHSS